MSVSGWYPDPAGTPQLRFWDGQSWTTALAPPPVTQQPTYAPGYPPGYPPAYAARRQLVASPYVSPRGTPRRDKRLYGWIAGGVAAAVAAVVVIPLAMSSHSPPTNAAFSRVLLSVNEVSTTGSATFTITPGDGSGDNDSSADCPGADLNQKSNAADEKAKASREFSDNQGQFAAEILSYDPGKAASQFLELKTQISKCKSITISGAALTFSVLPAPTVPGGDDTFGFQLSRTVTGRTIVVDEVIARFGDNIVGIVYGGIGDPVEVGSIANELLIQAATKAKSVL